MTVTNPEPEFRFEEVGDERTVGVHLDPIEAGERDHDSGDTTDDGVVVGRHVDAEQLVEGGHRVVLVDAIGRAAIANVVLRACRDIALPGDGRSSKASVRRNLSLEA